MVATYSLDCGTGARVTVTVCTGIACIPAAVLASVLLWQPVAVNPRRTKQPIPKKRFKSINLILCCLPYCNVMPAAGELM